jgi:hypothetical protein
MNMMSIWKSTLAVAALLTILLPMPGEAGPMGKAGPTARATPLTNQQKCLRVTKRPLIDFLKSQGTLNTPPQFFPPVKDYVGWADAVDPATELPSTFALVDYAGLANKWIRDQTGRSLGTEVTGYVLECRLASGKAQITVALFTTNALGFAQSVADLANPPDPLCDPFAFYCTPTIFGAKAQDVAKPARPAKPALGPVTIFTTFTINKPRDPLPDFLLVATPNGVPTDYAPAKLSCASTTFGRCANGTLARLDVHQNASTDKQGAMVYSTEKVVLHDSNGDSCQ